jgi:hypothetical protein
MAKTNYLNNRDLLKEIHLSKNNFSSYRDIEIDHQYDIILPDLSSINEDNIMQAKRNKVARTLKEAGEHINIEDISNSDLVFRIMTWQHIPLAKPKVPKTTSKNNNSLTKFFEAEENNEEVLPDIELDASTIARNIKSAHIRINFPPFFHYRLDNNDVAYIVGKSHWKGGLTSGEFSKDHGQITDNLARMIMKLSQKYAMKSCFYAYTYRDEMEAQAILQLCQVVLQFDESKSLNPFAFLTTVAKNSYIRILNLEKKNQQIRDQLLVDAGQNASYTYENDNKGWGE